MQNDIIRKPIFLTEKASRLREDENKVVFEVSPKANKIQIREAIQAAFGVSVLGVNTSIVRGHMKRMGRGYGKLRNWKKAVITLKAGDTIQFFDEESTEAAASEATEAKE
jgi:large subunit ribosomal protein L23